MSSQEQPSTGQAFLKQGTNITGTLPIDFVDHVCAEAGNTLRILFHLSSPDLIIGRRVVVVVVMIRRARRGRQVDSSSKPSARTSLIPAEADVIRNTAVSMHEGCGQSIA